MTRQDERDRFAEVSEPPDVDDHDVVLATAARILAKKVGLRFEPAIRGRLSRCLVESSRERGLDGADYVRLLDHDVAAVQDLLNRVTVQESSFFRDPQQFIALAEHILPAHTGQLTVWSAACSNGQEAYSLAMVLEESNLTDWKVIASDISTRALTRTHDARYATRELRGVSDVRRARHFRQVGDDWEINPALRERVQIVHHNLAADPPPFAPQTCPIVFCRNVLIYFRDEDIVEFLERLNQWQPTGGWLFLGYSESLSQIDHGYRLVNLGGSYIFQKPQPDNAIVGVRHPRKVSSAPLKTRQRSAPRRRTERPTGPAAQEVTVDGIDELLQAGVSALNAHDFSVAVSAFRRCIYLDPENVIAHVSLGLALEGAGDVSAARRAFGAARVVLRRTSLANEEKTIDGFQLEEYTRLVDTKLAGGSFRSPVIPS